VHATIHVQVNLTQYDCTMLNVTRNVYYYTTSGCEIMHIMPNVSYNLIFVIFVNFILTSINCQYQHQFYSLLQTFKVQTRLLQLTVLYPPQSHIHTLQIIHNTLLVL